MMNCQKYEALIALAVEGDLSERRAVSVADHLAACATCRQFAAELRESQATLRTAGFDDFTAATLTDLRQAVMNEIALRPQPGSFLSRFFRPLRWQSVVIAGLLILLAPVMLSWWLNAGSGQQPSNAGREPQPPNGSAQQVALSENTVAQQKKPISPGRRVSSPPVELANKTPPPISRERDEAVSEPVNQVAALVAPPENDSQFSAQYSDELLNSAMSELSTSADSSIEAENIPPADHKLRLEIQTRDPNIRIIWFVNKEPRRVVGTE